MNSFKPEMEVRDVGAVIEAGDGIARVRGLADVRAQELVQFANGVKGIAFNLEQSNVGVIIMGEYSEIEEGMEVRSTGRIASVPVGDGLVGRVVNALGEPSGWQRSDQIPAVTAPSSASLPAWSPAKMWIPRCRPA